MINEKLSELTFLTTLPDDAMVYFVDPNRSEGDRSVGMTVANAKILFGGSSSVTTLQEAIAADPTATTKPIFSGQADFGNGTIGVVTFLDGASGTTTAIAGIGGAFGFQSLNASGFTMPGLLLNGQPITSTNKVKWNASTNTPALLNTDTGAEGKDYVVDVAGSHDFGAGSITFGVGDIVGNLNNVYYKKVDNNQSGGGGSSTQYIVRNLSDLTTALTVGTTKDYFRMPFGGTLTGVSCSLLDAGTVTGVSVDINKGGVSILSTELTTDATEKTSTTATTPAVISDSSLPYDSEITFDITAIPTAGKGLMVTLEITPI